MTKRIRADYGRCDIYVPALEGTAHNTYSQFGEDGLIDAALGLVGVTNQWCFEVGASDGVEYSNTKALRDRGWRSVLIERDDRLFNELARFASDKVFVLHRTVNDSCTIDGLLQSVEAPEDVDFGCIDIDGQDYWVWSDMISRPQLMLVEYSPYCHPDTLPDRGAVKGQAGLNPIIALGNSKGYRELAVTAVNVLFGRMDLL